MAEYQVASEAQVEDAISSALEERKSWANMPQSARAAIFLKAAHLLSTVYRYELLAATMLGQGKNAWQAEIDAGAEIIDFLRFNVSYAEKMYAVQPPANAPGVWNRTEYRPLEGFVYAVTPFNFTAIAGNLVAAPALVGNVVLMKPSPSAVLSNYIVHRVLLEAGVPPNVIQFVPGDAATVSRIVFSHYDFAALHFTGSTRVFKSLCKQIADRQALDDGYRGYPRVVGETGGKNYHLVTACAHQRNAVVASVRSAFEYQGQKCSALSRLYVAKSQWESGFREQLVREVEALHVGAPEDDVRNFVGPVIHREAFERLRGVIDSVKGDPALSVIAGGKYDDSKGYFVWPTVVVSSDAQHDVFRTEFFGPFVAVYVFPDEELASVVDLIDTTTRYALTGAIFASRRSVINDLSERLRESAGNFYINDKCTGAVVGEQPFGGARASGTNDKAGSGMLLGRFVSPRSIKENFGYQETVAYPSNMV